MHTLVDTMNWYRFSKRKSDSDFANYEHKRKYKHKREKSIQNQRTMTSFEKIFYVCVYVSVYVRNSQSH